MPRDPRAYITVHHGMPDHPKIGGLSDGAFRLLVTLWCWCSQNETDGKVRVGIWSKRGTPRTRRELLAAGLVETDGGDFLMHDYLQHQRSAAEIAALREKRAAAGAKGGKAKANARASAKQMPEQMPSKPVADTEDKEPYLSSSPGSGNVPLGSIPRIVRAYVESAKASGLPVPKEAQDKVSRSARSLVGQGYSEDDITDAARNAAAGGWTDLATQLQRDASRAQPVADSESTGARRAAEAVQAGQRVAFELHNQAREAIA